MKDQDGTNQRPLKLRMTQRAEICKAYRQLPIFKVRYISHLFFSEIFLIPPNIQYLLESLETLEESGLIPLELLLRVVFQYDRTVASLLSQTEDQYTLEGRLAAFRLVRPGEHYL